MRRIVSSGDRPGPSALAQRVRFVCAEVAESGAEAAIIAAALAQKSVHWTGMTTS